MVAVLDVPLPASDRPARMLYSFVEAGAQIGVSHRQIRILVDAGEIRSVYIGRLHRIAHEDLADYVLRLRSDR